MYFVMWQIRALEEVRKKMEDAALHTESLLQKLETDNVQLQQIQKQHEARGTCRRSFPNTVEVLRA